jgi:hypothetical protein
MRRKAWLLDSPARKTRSDGDGHLRQEDCVGRLCRQGSMSGEVGRSRWRRETWRGRPSMRHVARALAGAGGSEKWGLCWLQSREAWGRAAVRDPRQRIRRRSLWRSPLGSCDACASSKGADVGRAAPWGGTYKRETTKTIAGGKYCRWRKWEEISCTITSFLGVLNVHQLQLMDQKLRDESIKSS